MKEIFLLRHGNTGYGDRYIGSTDVVLSPEGITEIHTTDTFLKTYDFDKVICSPLLRCRQTCSELSLKHQIIIDNRIREIDFGRWEQKTFREIERSDPELVNKWAHAENFLGFPEGDNIADFISRIKDFSSYVQTLNGKRLLIVTHGGVIRHLICSFLNLSFDNYLYFQIKSGCVSTINLHDLGGVLTGMNIGAFYE